jgi:hypothetical protein
VPACCCPSSSACLILLQRCSCIQLSSVPQPVLQSCIKWHGPLHRQLSCCCVFAVGGSIRN